MEIVTKQDQQQELETSVSEERELFFFPPSILRGIQRNSVALLEVGLCLVLNTLVGCFGWKNITL